MKSAQLTVDERLRPVLPARKRSGTFTISFDDTPSLKHFIEAAGIPHTEIGQVLVNGRPADLSDPVQDGDQILVLPVNPIEQPADADTGEASSPKFIADTHLGKLTTYLRMLGFDTWYARDADDETLAEIASRENRILLTRDRGLLKRKQVTQGYCVVVDDPEQQIRQVLDRFQLRGSIHPFQRCLRCNALLRPVTKEAVLDWIPAQSRQFYQEFNECPNCGQIYWKGSHYQRMQRFIAALLDPPSESARGG